MITCQSPEAARTAAPSSPIPGSEKSHRRVGGRGRQAQPWKNNLCCAVSRRFRRLSRIQQLISLLLATRFRKKCTDFSPPPEIAAVVCRGQLRGSFFFFVRSSLKGEDEIRRFQPIVPALLIAVRCCFFVVVVRQWRRHMRWTPFFEIEATRTTVGQCGHRRHRDISEPMLGSAPPASYRGDTRSESVCSRPFPSPSIRKPKACVQPYP